MIEAQILTWWREVPTPETRTSARCPHLVDLLLRPGERVIDISHTPAENLSPNPNLVLVQCTLFSNTYQAILDHPDYGTGSVFFSQEAAP